MSFLPDMSKTPVSHATLPLSVVSGLLCATHFRFYLFKINSRKLHEQSDVSYRQHATDKALRTKHMLESNLDLYLLFFKYIL